MNRTAFAASLINPLVYDPKSVPEDYKLRSLLLCNFLTSCCLSPFLVLNILLNTCSPFVSANVMLEKD
jgi:hypothetical protein